MIILYNNNFTKKKLYKAYREPFVIIGFAEHYQKSYYLQQINEDLIKRIFYINHLKFFKPKTGYLVITNEKDILIYHNLQANIYKTKIPKNPLTKPES